MASAQVRAVDNRLETPGNCRCPPVAWNPGDPLGRANGTLVRVVSGWRRRSAGAGDLVADCGLGRSGHVGLDSARCATGQPPRDTRELSVLTGSVEIGGPPGRANGTLVRAVSGWWRWAAGAGLVSDLVAVTGSPDHVGLDSAGCASGTTPRETRELSVSTGNVEIGDPLGARMGLSSGLSVGDAGLGAGPDVAWQVHRPRPRSVNSTCRSTASGPASCTTRTSPSN